MMGIGFTIKIICDRKNIEILSNLTSCLEKNTESDKIN